MPSSAALLTLESAAAGAELPVVAAALDDDYDADACAVLVAVAATGGSWTLML